MDQEGRLDIRLLGRLEVRFGGRRLAFSTRHAGFLLATLALEGPLSRDVAAARLWGERGEEQARASLRQTIYRVQKVLETVGAPGLQSDRTSVALPPEAARSDVADFFEELTRDPVSAAAKAFRGELLGDVGRVDPAFEDWLAEARRAFTERVARELKAAAERALTEGHWRRLDALASASLRGDPYDEAALCFRMEALVRSGRRTQALSLFDRFEETLQASLGVAPDEAARALRNRIASSSQDSLSPAETQKPTPEQAEPEPAATDFAAQEPEPQARRSVSLLVVQDPNISQDPEVFAQVFARLKDRLERALRDETALILQPAGAMLACVFGASGHVERHAEAAFETATVMRDADAGHIKFAVVSGDIIGGGETGSGPIALESVAHLMAAASDLLQTTAAGEIKLSGETAFRLAARSDDMEFVARRAELQQLVQALSAAEEGQAQIMGVVGEAGLGKSTLLRRFLNGVRQARVLTIEGYDRESARPFGALARFLMTVLEEKGAAEGAVAAEHAPAVAALLGRELPDQETASEDWRRHIFDAAASIVLNSEETEAATILAVEDLHWLDRDSAEFLDRLVGQISEERLLIIATFRPEHQINWIGRSSFGLLRLAPLARDEASRLVAPWFGEGETALTDLVLDRAEGNPFFLVEMARAASSQVPERQQEIPTTIRDVLLARVYRRPADDRFLLQCLAVMGVEVHAQALAALTGFDAQRLDAALQRLRQEELLVYVGAGSNPRHRFRHALLHDTVYESIPKAELRSLHAAAFAMLEGQSDVDPATVALHAWRSENWAAAFSSWRDAGDRFARLSSYALASEAYGKAILALNRVPPESRPEGARIELALRLRPVLVPLGRYHDALEELDLAESTAARDNDIETRIAALISKSYLFSTHGRLAEAIDMARQAASLCQGEEQPAFEAKLAEGQARSLQGDWNGTLSLLRPTLGFWESNRHERFGHTGTRSVWCHGHLSNALLLNGQLQAAEAHGQRAFEIATETQRPLDLIYSLHRLGRVQLASGNNDEALGLLEEAVRRTEEIDAPIFRSWFACDTVPALLAAQRLEDAEGLLERQIEAAEQLNLRQFQGWLALRRAGLQKILGSSRDASESARSALARAIEIGDLVLEPSAMALLAELGPEEERSDQEQVARKLAQERGLKVM